MLPSQAAKGLSGRGKPLRCHYSAVDALAGIYMERSLSLMAEPLERLLSQGKSREKGKGQPFQHSARFRNPAKQ